MLPTKRIVVPLTWGEVQLAAIIGIQRHILNLKLKREDAYGMTAEKGWQAHIDGAIGELAVAKHTGQFYSGSLQDLSPDDVGPYGVRATTRQNGRLFLHPGDEDDRAFVLALVGNLPECILAGWCYGGLGKLQQWWCEPQPNRPCFAVPQEVLDPMSDLPKLV